MPKRLTPQAILALQEALAVIYHYRNDLRSFLETCGVNRGVLAQLNWDQYKRYIVKGLFEVLLEDPDSSTPVITSLCRDVAAMDNFSHLARLENGDRKVATARAAVQELRRLVSRHDEQEEEERLVTERRKRLQETEVTQVPFNPNFGKFSQCLRM